MLSTKLLIVLLLYIVVNAVVIYWMLNIILERVSTLFFIVQKIIFHQRPTFGSETISSD